MQILILGMHRSGTSMLTRLVNLMGAYFGPESIATQANEENPKGFWERRDVRQLNDDVLFSVGADWHRIADYDPTAIPPEAQARFEEGARRIIAEMDAHRPWVMKEPRLCINLPPWLGVLERPVCLIGVRDPVEIARSLEARNQFPIPVGIAMTQTYYRRVLRATEGLPRAVVTHRDLMTDPLGTVRAIHAQVERWGVAGLRMLPENEVTAFVEPGLYRQRSTETLSRSHLTQVQAEFFAALRLQNWAALAEMLDAPEPELDVLRMFEAGLAKSERIKALADDTRRNEARIRALAAKVQRLDRDLTSERTKRRTQSKQHRSLIAATERHVTALEASRSWRLGYGLVAAGARVLGRQSTGSAFEMLRLRLTRAGGADQSKDPIGEAHALTLPAGRAAQRPLPAAQHAPRHKLTIAVIAWDTGHNPLGRAYLIAEALARRFNVLLIGPGFDRYGRDVWPPVREAPIVTIRLPGGELPEMAEALERLAPKIEADVIIACKARMPSLQLGLMMKAFRNRPLLVDVDDYELSFFKHRAPLDLAGLSAMAMDPDLRLPYSEPWTRYAESLVALADQVLVSNGVLQAKFGGLVIPHARDESLFDPMHYDRASARARFGYTLQDKVVLFLGTPRRHKGVLEVAKALRACDDPHYKLCIIGSFDDRALERELLKAGDDLVKLVPNQPITDLPQNLVIADVVCLYQDPASEISKYQLPAKVVDALAMGVPVISTALAPLRPLIEAGAVITADEQTLVQVLRQTLDHSERLMREQRDRRDLFLRDYSYTAIARALEEQILGLLDGGVQPLGPGALAFLDLQRSLGDAEAPTRVALENDPHGAGIDIVLFWKQNDSGLYGRRSDMFAKYLARHPRVRQVLVLDPPISLSHLMLQQDGEGITQTRQVFIETWCKRWGLRDGEGVSRNLFIYSNDRTESDCRIWPWPAEGDYARFLRDCFGDRGIDPTQAVFLVYPKNEAIRNLVDTFQPRLVVADVVDDHRTWPDLSPQKVEALTAHYREVVSLADLVIANCEQVQQSMSAFGKSVALITNACETEPPPPVGDSPEARAFQALKGAKVGYVGNMEAKFDVALLHYLAGARPHWQYVLIGSTHANPAVLELRRHPNVHFFGVIPYPRVRAWIAQLDVAIIPHLDTPQTRSMNPLKLYVYASVGVPVVSTRIDNLDDLADWVTVAECKEGFLRATEQAIERHHCGRLPDLRARLVKHSWSARVDQFMDLVEPILANHREQG